CSLVMASRSEAAHERARERRLERQSARGIGRERFDELLCALRIPSAELHHGAVSGGELRFVGAEAREDAIVRDADARGTFGEAGERGIALGGLQAQREREAGLEVSLPPLLGDAPYALAMCFARGPGRYPRRGGRRILHGPAARNAGACRRCR